MDFNVIREYIVSNNIIGENVFLLEKPKSIICDDYIIYNFKELDGASTIRTYQLDVRVISKDKLKAIEIKNRLINILDIYYKDCKIKDDEIIIRDIRLVNGGGMTKHEEKDEYNIFLYFLVKI